MSVTMATAIKYWLRMIFDVTRKRFYDNGCRLNGIHHTLVTPYHLTSNGIVKHAVKTFRDISNGKHPDLKVPVHKLVQNLLLFLIYDLHEWDAVCVVKMCSKGCMCGYLWKYLIDYCTCVPCIGFIIQSYIVTNTFVILYT